MNWPILQEGEHYLLQFSNYDGQDIHDSTDTIPVEKGEATVIERIQEEEKRAEKNNTELNVAIFKYTAKQLFYKKEIKRVSAKLTEKPS